MNRPQSNPPARGDDLISAFTGQEVWQQNLLVPKIRPVAPSQCSIKTSRGLISCSSVSVQYSGLQPLGRDLLLGLSILVGASII